jgi:hypothetical protein
MTGGSYDISIWWRNTMISMSLSVSVHREDRSRPRIRHRPRQQRVKATADHGRWWRTLPAQSSDRGFGALHLRSCSRRRTQHRHRPFRAGSSASLLTRPPAGSGHRSLDDDPSGSPSAEAHRRKCSG